MIHINLLPADTESKPITINPAIPMAALAVTLVVVLIPINLKEMSGRKTLQDQKASLTSELERYQPILAQVEALETAQNQLKQRKTVIEQLQSERLRYPQFMDDFVKLLPSNLWLTSLITSPGTQAVGNSMAISMDVVSLDNYAIADLISNLETSQIFSDVDLGTINAAQGPNGTQMISFHVNANYHKVSPLPDASKKS